MEDEPDAQRGWRIRDFHWGVVGAGYLISLSLTVVVGIPLFLATENTWLLAPAGLGGLLIGGFVVGRAVGANLAIINGALMATLYYLTLALAFFMASFAELLPEPLPGLPQGDSTFYFAWPLAQFVVGLASAAVGSRFALKNVERGA